MFWTVREDLNKVIEECAQVSGDDTTARPSPTEEPEYTTASPPTGTTEDPDSDHTTGTTPTPTTAVDPFACTPSPQTTTTRDPTTQEGYACGGHIAATDMPNKTIACPFNQVLD